MSEPTDRGPQPPARRTDAGGPGGTGPDDLEAIQAEIDATRAQLGRTVEELTYRLDVPARAREGVYRARDTAVETYRENPPIVLGTAAALVAMLVGLMVLRWKREQRAKRRTRSSTRRRR